MPSVTDWISAISSAISAAGILGAGWWFFYTNQVKPRVQFDLDCRFFRSRGQHGVVLAEIWCVFENKGFVEHRLYDLRISTHVDVPSETTQASDASTTSWFTVTRRESIVPTETGFYFVRPEVNQVIRHVVTLPATAKLLRVTAAFEYHRGDKYPHTARRVFVVPAENEAQLPPAQQHNEALQLPEARDAQTADAPQPRGSAADLSR